MKEMNEDETISYEFLSEYIKELGFQTIIYEPHGNKTPDFCIDERIGVEVRRLNQNVVSESGEYEGVENVIYGLQNKFYKFLSEQTDTTENSWRIDISVRRPIDLKGLFNEVKSTLIKFQKSNERKEQTITIRENLTISLKPTDSVGGKFFRFGRFRDLDRGGWYDSHLLKNIRISIEKKESKVLPHKHRFKEWWLVLVDYIDPTFYDDYQLEELKTVVEEFTVFDKIIILDKVSKQPKFIHHRK